VREQGEISGSFLCFHRTKREELLVSRRREVLSSGFSPAGREKGGREMRGFAAKLGRETGREVLLLLNLQITERERERCRKKERIPGCWNSEKNRKPKNSELVTFLYSYLWLIT
jgi:hypothetical protein